MSLKFTKAEQGKIIARNEEYQTITVEGVIAETGILSGLQISPDALKGSSRWLLGRPLKLNDRKVGQVDEVDLQGSTKLAVKASIMTVKLSQAELFSLVPEGDFTLKGAFFPITKPADGAVGGESFKETAVSLEWDHVVLEIPELKGHSAESKWDRLERLNMQMNAALGR